MFAPGPHANSARSRPRLNYITITAELMMFTSINMFWPNSDHFSITRVKLNFEKAQEHIYAQYDYNNFKEQYYSIKIIHYQLFCCAMNNKQCI
jgi:hypothetical protein